MNTLHTLNSAIYELLGREFATVWWEGQTGPPSMKENNYGWSIGHTQYTYLSLLDSSY